MKKLVIVLSFLIGFNLCYAEDPWVKQELPNPYLISKVKFIDSLTGFLMGFDNFLKTTDGGNSWNEIIIVPFGGNGLTNFDIFGDGNGFILRANSTFSISSNYGNTWTDFLLPTKYYYTRLSALDKNRVWIMSISDRALLFTTNGGKTWDSTIINNFENINLFGDIHFVDSLTGFIATDKGSLLQTTDGGKTWFEKSTGINKYLYEISFTDKNNGWIGGTNGIIIHTTDGGENWQTVASPSTEDIVAIYFINEKEGYASTISGSGFNVSGKIYYTSDGGTTWVFQHQEPNDLITSFSFLNKNVGWAGGGSGVLLHLDKTSSVEENINEMIEKRTAFLFSDKKSYPMPASSTVRSTVYWNDNYYFIENAKIEVYTSFGEKISNPEISIEKLAPYQANIVWNCGVYAPGIYFIRVTLADETVSIPIMVSR
ncbi:MAG: YCF48-related protein [Chloroherpetonaceae bacterium]